MATQEVKETKKQAETFGKILRAFGDTLGEILDDPELRKKAKELAETAVDAAARVVDKKIQKEDVRDKFRKVGKAAETLGKSLQEEFKSQ